MPTNKKVPITEVGRFYERISEEPVNGCPVCRDHKYVILQKFGNGTGVYGMHTMICKSPREYCMHLWTLRNQDPACLSNFVPTDFLVSTAIHASTLRNEIFELVRKQKYVPNLAFRPARKRPGHLIFPDLEN